MKIGITERGDAALDQTWRTAQCDVDFLILITKNPSRLGSIPSNAIVHCTITGYGGGIIEPGVPPPEISLRAYNDIFDAIGPQRTVLRIDPIIPTVKGIQKALSIFRQSRGRVRISFIDAYPHVQARFKAAGLPPLPTNGQLHFPLSVRQQTAAKFPNAEICGEPGMPCTGCVSQKDLDAFGIAASNKLKGQRPACACLAAKTELLSKRSQCAHKCLYCYWR